MLALGDRSKCPDNPLRYGTGIAAVKELTRMGTSRSKKAGSASYDNVSLRRRRSGVQDIRLTWGVMVVYGVRT